MALSGGCRCGACRYTLDYEALPMTYACHCRDCQTMSGSALAIQAMVPLAKLAFSGATLGWEHPNSTGKITTQIFCAQCRTRIYSTNEGRPGVALIRAGTLDESADLIPTVHIWASRKQPWIQLDDDVEAYAENAPGERMITLLAPNFA
jgi:hypothetical protein